MVSQIIGRNKLRGGFYKMANPALGRVKHHLANGYLLRMRGETSGQINLIAASEIILS
jgi:hypothetical protein